jgi:flagellar motility protein MotE (MotC chaperone)/sporulation protein YlmC with PRC-barrel domain
MQKSTEIFVRKLNGLQCFDPSGDFIGKMRDVVLILSSSRAVGLVVEVYGKRQIFVPLSRVKTITSEQIVISGLVNMKRFEKREVEDLAFKDFVGLGVEIKNDEDGNKWQVQDFSIVQHLNSEWHISQVYVSRATNTVHGIQKLFKNPQVESKFIKLNEIVDHKTGEQSTDHIIESIEQMKPADAADVIMDLEDERQVEIAEDLDNERLADVLEEMPEAQQLTLIEQFDNDRAADVLEEMEADDAADLLKMMPEKKAEELLDEMNPDDANDVRRLLKYSNDTAGGLMNPNTVVLTPDSTVNFALAKIRREILPPSVASAVFICRQPIDTPTGKFLGILHFQQLLRTPPHVQLGSIVDQDVCYVKPSATLDEVARVFAMYNSLIIPVLDDDYRLLGAISVDDLIDHMLPSNWRDLELINGGHYNE